MCGVAVIAMRRRVVGLQVWRRPAWRWRQPRRRKLRGATSGGHAILIQPLRLSGQGGV
jgi:hypothetical protein